MRLPAGTHLGPYELIALVGAGGMGEVYRARDTRLHREVAIKLLPPEFALDPERVRRFEQEARAASALNHPNILTVFDVGSRDEGPYLVTELLEGDSLREVLRRERPTVARAVDYGLQIARGLAVAHHKGIVHRDLKPENLFVTQDGRVKILDFGLARLSPRQEGEVESSQAATRSSHALTEQGTVLGTVGYMSPEQVRGEAADARSDVFAFGAVLYEVLAGRRAFARDTAAETMTAILREEPPPLAELRPEVPAPILRLLDRCLAKRLDERFASGREVLFALEVSAATSYAAPAAAVGTTPDGRHRTVRRIAGWLLVGTVGAVLAMTIVLSRPPRSEGPTKRDPVVSSLVLPEEEGALASWSRTADIALSPDGTRLAYVGIGHDRRPAIWIRDLGSASVRELAGTHWAINVFWSPDGRFVGFFAQDKLKKAPADGGPVQVLCDAPGSDRGNNGATWSRDDVILLSQGTSLARVAAAGGTPQTILERDPATELYLRFPSFLPDGRRFLYYVRRTQGKSRVYVGSLDGSAPPTLVHEGDSRAVLTAAGLLLFVRDDTLLAQPVDDRSLLPRGEPVPLATRVAHHVSGRASFSVSEHGRLAYTEAADLPTELVWRDRQGRIVERITDEGRYIGAELAPDGRRVAVEIEEEGTNLHAVWLLGPARGVHARLTRPPHDGHHPAWSPDGRQLAFTSSRTGKWLVYRQRTDGLGDDTLLHDSPEILELFARQWTPDGRAVIAVAGEADDRRRLWLLPVTPGEGARALVDGHGGRLSPDGRWLAVASRLAGSYQIHVLPYPALDTRWQVSTDGGTWPRWRADGRELFYVADDRVLMSARVGAGPDFEAAAPQALFPLALRDVDLSPTYPHEYDVDAAGERFLVCQVSEHAPPSMITVISDWEGLVASRP